MPGIANTNLSIYARACLVIFLLLTHPLFAQTPSTPILLAGDLAKTGILDNLAAGSSVCFTDAPAIAPEQLPSLSYTGPGIKQFEHFIPPGLVNKTAVLTFSLCNSSNQ